MYLRKLHLENFRSCALMDLELDPALTILAGENNSGKTTLLDAIRLLTAPLDDRRDLWARAEDITRGETPESFVISGEFADLTNVQRGLNIAALGDLTGETFRYGLSYTRPRAGERRGRITYWAGVENGGDPEPEARDLIRHVHLPALRDALRALSSGSSERIGLILRHLAGTDAVESLEAVAKEAFEQVEHHEVIKKAGESIQRGLTRLTEGVAAQDSGLAFAEPKLERLARDLRFRLADAGVDLAELSESGLGYANLLYMATVIAELDAASDADLTLMLVEEPEAHLHPQLQLAVLAFLEAQANESRSKKVDAAQPAGHIQILVTTHSPNITAATSIERVVVLTRASQSTGLDLSQVPLPTPGQTAHPLDGASLTPQGFGKTRRACAIPVRKLGLTSEIREKLDRYIDVTRSSLLFARRALLVEGISEAILLRTLGREIVLEKESPVGEAADEATRTRLDQESREIRAARSRFDATVILPIEGVDFEPYLRILLTPVDGVRLAERLVAVTDLDPQLSTDRAAAMKALSADLGAEQALSVFVGKPTLEAELLTAGNEEFIRGVFLALHPKSADRWQDEVVSQPSALRGEAFVKLLQETRTRKGQLAQEIASRIKTGTTFVTPAYLIAAIREIAKK